LDKVGSGFITHEGWLRNINEIISFTEDEKENLFSYMDKGNTKVIDYKTFLALMNGESSTVQSEKFDWAEKTLKRIKEWFGSSSLTAEDAFNLIDRDGDTYLSEKDLHEFLV
jgi:Ca2+-binding EF-hand superfamily protein